MKPSARSSNTGPAGRLAALTKYASGDGAAANAFSPPVINTATLRLLSGCKAQVGATIGISSGSSGQAVLVARELTFARVTPLPILQTIGIILAPRCGLPRQMPLLR
jgi:hypothetical protein